MTFKLFRASPDILSNNAAITYLVVGKDDTRSAYTLYCGSGDIMVELSICAELSSAQVQGPIRCRLLQDWCSWWILPPPSASFFVCHSFMLWQNDACLHCGGHETLWIDGCLQSCDTPPLCVCILTIELALFLNPFTASDVPNWDSQHQTWVLD